MKIINSYHPSPCRALMKPLFKKIAVFGGGVIVESTSQVSPFSAAWTEIVVVTTTTPSRASALQPLRERSLPLSTISYT